MAESVLEVVEKLQSRLSTNAEPRKLKKTLKRLCDLPITVDILVETGIGKTVNGLRKHEDVGDLAKSLVAQWKKLVPQETPRVTDSEEREHCKSSSRKRQMSPSPRYDEEEYEEPQSIHQSDSLHRQPFESHGEHIKEEKSWQHSSDYEDSDDGQGYSPEPSQSPPVSYRDKPVHKAGKEPKYLHKEKHHVESKGLNSEKKKDRFHEKEVKKGLPSSAGSSREKILYTDVGDHQFKKEKIKHSESKSHNDYTANAKKHKHQDRLKNKEEQAADMQNLEIKKKKAERDPEAIHDKREKSKSKTGTQEKKSIKLYVPPSDQELEDEFEKPTMSFESYLSYDQPQKKKKKPVVKSTAVVPEKNIKKHSESRTESRNKDQHKKKSEILPHKERNTEKRESSSSIFTKIEQVPVLPDIPLPLIQPNYRPLPSIESVPFSPHKRKAPMMSMQEDEESEGFTGRRFNSKMQVYSGSKTAYLPKMMSLYEQCIRVLANNIDSIYEVGGVPFSVLEPVLEKCTPDQLCHIEEYNHVLIEDTDRLWMNHCQRDFKKEKREEFESWREMYLRLHEAREQRLLKLTQNIRSAHANKPKGRQAKMAFVNSAVKPPRDVRRRQERFGTGGAAIIEKSRIKPYTPISNASNHVESEEPRSFEGPSTSTSVSPPTSAQPSHDPRKPQIKKVAPMMAKTIKAFKNRFFRR
ncbi:hypothetical protein GDO86_003724 [Hymenochirus boettgeri]|uniref:TFIIS N-terminal domain-containing protein n=1 Tax=Hymenochirus boettgeri TaxID=247094 RepID=A0A8T2K8F6_9PIPI|nr:hypothetical protein GDO86_003724 [Hymenochirus boettgeri]